MSESKRVIVTGATGLIGKALCQRLQQRGYAVVVFSRDPGAARLAVPGAAEYVAWRPEERGPWATAVDGAYGVIHLAGASIAGQRWTPAYKREIRDSRVIGTRGIVNAIGQARQKPEMLVSMSGIDYYGPRGDTPLGEDEPPGSGFLSQVCIEWEREALRAETFGVRTVVVRNGIVLDKHEGALARLLLPFRMFAGGPVLPGTQWWSWIHLEDEVGIILLALEEERAHGPLNGTAPNPLTNREFSATLGRVMGRPSLAPIPLFALEILLGEMAGPLLVDKQKVLPQRAVELGYRFRYPELEPALRQILKG